MFSWRRLLIAILILAVAFGLVWQRYGGRVASMLAMDRERTARGHWKEGTNGMIAATTGGAAVQAGAQILKEGGNAADAAIAIALTEIVHAGGSYVSFAGAMIALYYDASTGKVYSLNACYNTPLRENDPLSIPKTGGRTVPVPGFMAGAQAMHDRFGTMSFKRLLEPAIDLAEKGEPLNGMLAWQIESKKSVLSRFPETKRIFTKENGGFYGISLLGGADLFRQPELAGTLKQAAAKGASYMYNGEWGRKFVEVVQRNGGKITAEDMRNYQVIWEEPLQSTYRGHPVYAAGLSTWGGVDLVEALNLLELADLKRRGHWTNSAESLFWFNQIMGCRDYLHLPRIIDGRSLSQDSRATKETSAWIWQQMQGGKWPSLAGGEAVSQAENKHSAAIVVVDHLGNMAVLIHSINTDMWGNTGLFVDGVSIPDSAAFQSHVIKLVGPGQRLPTTPSPLMIFQDDKPILGCGSIGAEGGMEKMAQVVANILDFEMEPQAAVDAPAFLKVGWQKGINWEHGIIAQFEHGSFDPKVLARLKAYGMQTRISRDGAALGFYVGIKIDPKSRSLKGAVSRGLDNEQVVVTE